MAIGNKIVELRKRHDLTQLELAEKLHINRSVLNRIELGTRPVRDDELILLAKFFDVSTDYLLDRKETEYYNDPDVAQLAEELRTNPGMKILFDASKDSRPEDIQQAADLLAFLKERNS